MTKDLIFRKNIDWSSLYWGFTIPIPSHKKFHDYNGKYIKKGTHEKVIIHYKTKKFKGVLRNADRKAVKSDTLQMLYSMDSEFLNNLRKEFRSTYKYLLNERALALKKGKKKPYIKVPNEMKEYLEIYGTGKPFEYEIRFIINTDEKLIPKEIKDVKKEIKFLESKILDSRTTPYPFIPDIFTDLVDISFGKVKEKKYTERAPEYIFEDLIFYAFNVLGYDESKQLGYHASGKKKGHPDGQLKSHNSDYLVIYDAKERKDGYKMNLADQRAMEDYVKIARARNFKKIYCLIISSKFSEYPRSISGCPLTYLTAKKLVQLLSLKIQNPENINPLSLEDFFSQGTLVEDDDLKSWIDDHEIKTLDLSNILTTPSLDTFF